ncbi:DUF742 domain-containing protein [Catenulispora pinisilvae]|uniref:DUF742 domain-containing protein n=1 Tax=Catenulispora pinisilvae TaxID=2705253 RepID=UPI001891FE6D|nr:DUF742 domain-containing protein [Catenulispora pinisilvae]
MTRPRRDPDLVRAYVVTGGVLRPSRDVGLVTLLVAQDVPGQGLAPEQRRVLGVCSRHGALSIAEIAAHLDLPPSVVTILAAALMDSGHLAVPTPVADVPDIDVLKEVLRGLRQLV